MVKASVMDIAAVESLLTGMIGQYGWLFIAGFCVLLFKNIIANVLAAVMFMFGSDFNVDDVVYISGDKKARIIRQTPIKTVFHLLETDRRLIILNTDLYKLKIEKVLPGSNNGEEL